MSETSDFSHQIARIENNPEVCSALGLFVARWSIAEFSLVMPLVRVLGCTQDVAFGMLAAVNSATAKSQFVRAAIRNEIRFHASERKLILDALNKFDDLSRIRDSLMHHPWTCTEEGRAMTINYRELVGSPKRTSDRTATDLINLCNNAVGIASEISEASQSYEFAKIIKNLFIKLDDS